MSGWYAALAVWAIALPAMYVEYKSVLWEEFAEPPAESLTCVLTAVWPVIEFLRLIYILLGDKTNDEQG
jgi:hypothetical protein